MAEHAGSPAPTGGRTRFPDCRDCCRRRPEWRPRGIVPSRVYAALLAVAAGQAIVRFWLVRKW
jgi:hypothetical protein